MRRLAALMFVAIPMLACVDGRAPRSTAPVIVVPQQGRAEPAITLPADASSASAACDGVEAYVAEVDRQLPLLSSRKKVEGEDATSGFLYELHARGKSVVRVRRAWNGGCCATGEIVDHYLRDGRVVAVIESTADLLDGDVVLRGQDPNSKKLRSRQLFCGDRMNAATRAAADESVRVLIDAIDAQD